jgi:hypothetical protein
VTWQVKTVHSCRRGGHDCTWQLKHATASLGFHQVWHLIDGERPANLLSAAECGRGSGRKELGDERVGGQRESMRSGKFVKGSEEKASELQFKIRLQ